MQTQRTAAAAQEKPLETPVKIEEEPTEEDEFFNFVNDLLDLRMADFKKEPVEGLSDIKDDYGPPAAVASRRQSKAVSVKSNYLNIQINYFSWDPELKDDTFVADYRERKHLKVRCWPESILFNVDNLIYINLIVRTQIDHNGSL